MKHLKTKLSAAIVMLLISAMMLTGVSFAWYTLSTNPEVKGITATAVANENLEIALDNFYTAESEIDTASSKTASGNMQGSTTENDYTWGNMVDVTNQMKKPESSERYAFELRPAKYVTDTGLKTYTYGTDGRISAEQALTESDQLTTKAYYNSTGASTAADADTVRRSAQNNGVARVFNDDSATDENYAFKVVYWLRTNEGGGNITLSKAEKRADGADNAGLETGGGSTLAVTNSQKDKANATGSASTFVNEDFGVVFKVTDASGNATWTRATNTDGVLTGTIITGVVANSAYKVEMFVFLDGEKVTNADAAGDASIAVNVQFDNSKINQGGAMTY